MHLNGELRPPLETARFLFAFVDIVRRLPGLSGHGVAQEIPYATERTRCILKALEELGVLQGPSQRGRDASEGKYRRGWECAPHAPRSVEEMQSRCRKDYDWLGERLGLRR